MGQKKTFVFSMCIAAVYAIAIALLSASIILSYKEGNTRWDDRFNDIVRKTASAAAVAEPGTPAFNATLITSLEPSENVAGLQLSDKDKLLFSYPASMEGIPSATSLFVRSKSTQLDTKNTTLTLVASIYILSPDALFGRCAIAFFVILAATVALIIYMASLPREAQTVPEEQIGLTQGNMAKGPELDVRTALPESFAQEPVKDSGKEAHGTVVELPAVSPKEKAPDAASPEEKAAQPAQEAPAEAHEGKERHELSHAQAAEPSGAEVSGGQNGLFSPASGFGWQAYMKPRLDSELERAAASDMDLTLVTLKVPGISRQSEVAGEIAKAVLDVSGFKDLVFEYGDDGYSIILQDMGVDAALKKAETLYDRIDRELAYENLSIAPAIGLSARSLRLISAERLSNESEQALVHALGEEGKRIIAFRVNPDKYRNFLSSGAEMQA